MPNLRRQTEQRLAAGKPALLVSLPRNDLELARAAAAGGAEGLKVHINVHHRASGTCFGSLAEEADFLERVVTLGLPVGIVPGGAEAMASPEEMRRLSEIGIDYFDAYIDDMPAWMLTLGTGMSPMVALGPRQAAPGWALGPISAQVAMIEASVIEPSGYGEALTVGDLAVYGQIVGGHPGQAVIVPTQRAIRPQDVGALFASGARALLIGAIVTGAEAGSIEQATRRFRAAIDAL